MAGPLANLYSTADRLKRRLSGLLEDPAGTAQQFVGNLNDQAGRLNRMTSAAAQESSAGIRSGQSGWGPANDALAQSLAAAYNPGGIFIGPSSRLWDSNAAFEAAKMARKNVDPREIWRQTGSFKSPDGYWRQEIDDSGSRFVDAAGIADARQAVESRVAALKGLVRPSRTGQGDLFPKHLTEARKPIKREIGDLETSLERYYGYGSNPQYTGNFAEIAYQHPSLYSAYPELKSVVIRQGENRGPGAYGQYGQKQLDVFQDALKTDPRSTATHEMQHAVQDLEGFARGGTPDEFAAFRAHVDPYEGYRRLAGEAEARAVQNRLGYSAAQRRAAYPLDDYDLSQGQVIVVPQGQALSLDYLLER